MVWFFAIGAFLLLAAAGLYWRWRRNIDAEIAEGASVEWAHYQKHGQELVKGLTEEEFREIYDRVHRPRFPGYALAMAATFFASLPITFSALMGGLWLGDVLGIRKEPIALAEYVILGDARNTADVEHREAMALELASDFAGFYFYFGMFLSWILIVWFYMRRYHRRRPGYLRDEIIRARE